MGGRRKQYLELDGVPILLRSLRPFLDREDVVEVVVALPPDDVETPPQWLRAADPRIRVVAGGETRAASVRAALNVLSEVTRVVAVHDGARPLIDAETVERCVRTARDGEGAVAGCPAVDTMKEVDEEARVVATPDRSRLWHAHTPQVFPRKLIVEAYAEADPGELEATDDASLVERRGEPLRMIRCTPRNIKVTRPADLAVARALLEEEPA